MASTYAQEGSAAHELARMALTEGRDAAGYVGRIVRITQGEHARLSASSAHRWMNCPGSLALEGEAIGTESSEEVEVEITADMAGGVQVYLDHVRRHVNGGSLLVEQRVHFGAAIGVEDGWGTADAVIVDGDTLKVIDLKFGRGVQVFVEGNEQLLLYGLGALFDFGTLGDFAKVELHIVQPRIDHIDLTTVAVAELHEFARAAMEAAREAVTPSAARIPGAKQCRFCKAKATCDALRDDVTITTGNLPVASPEEFELLEPVTISAESPAPWLAVVMRKADLIEEWLKAVRAEVERRLVAGEEVPGWKLVEGRRGNRQWSDETTVTATLKAMRLKVDEMYDFKLISPVKAEKLLKDSPKRWARVSPLIVQLPGKPSVAPAADKRPALQPNGAAQDFPLLEA